MDENVSLLLVGLMEVAKTDQERAKVDALSERCRKEGPSALRKFMQEEPMILRLLDVAYGKEVVDIALGKAAEKMGVDLDDLLKKTVAKRGHFHFSENPGQIIRLSRPSFSVMRQGARNPEPPGAPGLAANSENGFDEMARRARNDRVIEFPYLVMFRNEHGHFVSVGGGSEFKTEKEATAKAKEKCDELKMTVYVMEAIELHEPKKSNK